MEISRFEDEFRFLSNFHPSPVKYEGPTWPTVEHGYQAMKTLDQSERKKIFNAPTAAKAKQLGKKVTLRPDWEKVKLQVMLDLLRLKFQDQMLADLLKATGDLKLVEGNTWGDRFWGICKGSGQNHLGRLLMQVREELRAKESHGEGSQLP